MTDLKSTIVTNIESILNSKANGCTIYKHQFTIPESVGINLGSFDGQYIFAKSNNLKVAVFYKVSYNSIGLCFFKYTSDINGVFSKNYQVPLFDTEKLNEVITLVFSNIQF